MTVDVLILYDLLVSHYMTVEKIRPKTARLVLIIMLSLQFILIAKIGRHSNKCLVRDELFDPHTTIHAALLNK